MELLDFLQWAGVGGVALLSIYFSQKDKNNSNEQEFIRQMKEQLDNSDDRYERLLNRIEKIEEINATLRSENLNITHERNTLLISKQNMEKELVLKIETLVKENEALKKRIRKLEKLLESNKITYAQ